MARLVWKRTVCLWSDAKIEWVIPRIPVTTRTGILSWTGRSNVCLAFLYAMPNICKSPKLRICHSPKFLRSNHYGLLWFFCWSCCFEHESRICPTEIEHRYLNYPLLERRYIFQTIFCISVKFRRCIDLRMFTCKNRILIENHILVARCFWNFRLKKYSKNMEKAT